MRCLPMDIIVAAPNRRRIFADRESERPSMRATFRPDVLDDSDSTKRIGLVEWPPRCAAILMQDML
jgi:hypothetical protein